MPSAELQRRLPRVLAEGPAEGALIAKTMLQGDLADRQLGQQQLIAGRLHPRAHDENLRAHPKRRLEQPVQLPRRYMRQLGQPGNVDFSPVLFLNFIACV
jgi:hypothetical protein